MASLVAATATTSTATASDPPLYFDEKWKMSKKESLTRSTRPSSFPIMKNSSHRRCSFTRKCARLVKEQRARFYIMRRCVTMLICWHDYTDSWSDPHGETHKSNKPNREELKFSLFLPDGSGSKQASEQSNS